MVLMQALKNLENVSHLAINIGNHVLSVSSLSVIKYEDILGEFCPVLEDKVNRLQTTCFQGKNMVAALNILKDLLPPAKDVYVNGSSVKVNDLSEENLKPSMKIKLDAAFSVKGSSFLLKNNRDEAFTIHNSDVHKIKFTNEIESLYPHLLVIIDKEVSFVQVISPDEYEILGSAQVNIKDLLSLHKSSSGSCDLVHCIGLAKLYLSLPNEDEKKNTSSLMSQETNETVLDESRALFGLAKVFYSNVAQMSALYAKMSKLNKVIFRDCVVNESFTKEILSEAMEVCSAKSVVAVFLRHESFISGIGAILSCSSVPESTISWYENYSESTGMAYQFCFFDGIETKQLTMDSLKDTQLACPLLLNPSTYCPDNQNLTTDSPAREYWIKCISDGVRNGMNRQISETTNPRVSEGLGLYRDMVVERMDYLNSNPQAYGDLCMRILQDTLEHMKRETGLITAYERRKQLENETALNEFEERIKYIDSLSHDERQEELIISMLAGNMFDWGSGEITKLMRLGNFGFMQAMEKLPVRPWLVDDLDQWVERTHGPPYNLAMIFCDNCGYDLILGIIPFARELLKRETKVIICVNQYPVLNDVTYYDMKSVIEKMKNICPIIKAAYDNNRLSIMEVSKSTCCLDLRCVDAAIARKMTEADLFVIEGMGRAIHTNLKAELNCEALRIGVSKDRWLSQQLGGESFACICKYTS